MVIRQDRKEQILAKAVDVFAELGYYKATTARVAKEAGVTQPYVFHFFSNKEELFIAVIDQAIGRIADAFSRVEAPADQLMETMGQVFDDVMSSYRAETLLVMQAHTIPEPAIREHVRGLFPIYSVRCWRNLPPPVCRSPKPQQASLWAWGT